MLENRKEPRYPIRLRVYFPELKVWGHTVNVSSGGCYIAVQKSISEGLLTDFWVELPLVGTVALKGYIHHSKGPEPGLGLQLVGVRFDYAQTEAYSLFLRFVKHVSKLTELGAEYGAFVEKGVLKRLAFPDDPEVS